RTSTVCHTPPTWRAEPENAPVSVIEGSIDPRAAVAPPRGIARIGDFVALTKPRVMSLVMFTAMVGFVVAPGQRDALTGCLALLCIAAGGGRRRGPQRVGARRTP